MRGFIGKTTLFLLGLLLMITAAILLSASCGPFDSVFAFITCSEDYTNDEEVVKAGTILSAMEKGNDYTSLIIGDSVSYMLFAPFQEFNEEYLVGSASRPFTMAGQYVVAKEFLDSHPDAKEVYLFFSKESWEAILDVQCGYNQAVVPMILSGTYDDLDDETKEDNIKTYGRFLLNPYIVDIFHRSRLNHKLVLNGLIEYHEKILGEDCSALYEKTDGEISPLSKVYFKKLVNLCGEHDVTLHVLHDPMADTEKKHKEIKKEKKELKEAGYMDIYDEYFESVVYYPKDEFIDEIHFGVTTDQKKKAIADIKKRHGYLQGFAVE